jgi:uncharacterized protein
MSGSLAAVPKSPSSRLWRMRRPQVALSAGVAALAAATAAGLAAGDAAAAVAVAAAVAGGLLALWFARNRVRAWSYTEQDEDLIVARGVLVRRLSVVPYGRMQFVDVTAGPVERAFQLATVKLHTAAAAGRDVRAEFRDRPAGQAARLVEELATLSREARRRVPERGVLPVPPAPEVQARLPGAAGTPAQAGPL